MRFARTVEGRTDALFELASGEQPCGFDDFALSMDPLGLDGIEPGALDRQGTGDNAHTVLFLFHLLIVGAQPRLNGVTAMPRRIIPHQKEDVLALSYELGAAPVQEGNRHRTQRPAVD